MKKSLVRWATILATLGAASTAGPASATPAHPAESAAGTFSLPSTLVKRVEDVPISELMGQALAAYKPASAAPKVRPLQKLAANNPLLVSNAKPEIVFVGGEFCPYCATERWSMVMALSKFGTFSHLVGTTSSSTDVYPNSPSFSFYRSSYSSSELVFVGDEMFNNHVESATGYPVLQKPTAEEQALYTRYDAPPYTPSGESGGIPFIYLAGRFVLIGPQWLAAQLSGLSWPVAATMLTSSKSVMSKAAEAAAGLLVGDICAVTHGKPTSVCSQVPSTLLGVFTSTPRS